MTQWPGRWVADRLNVKVRTAESAGGVSVEDLVGLAVRRNPRRSHLLVSTVLGKHVPTDPALIHESGCLLGQLASAALAGEGPAVVLGYAETATALGHCVADAVGDCWYVHSTRRRVAGIPDVFGFEEEHSHATSHRVTPTDPSPLLDGRPLVLVDDELSTGTTVLNTIAAVHAVAPRGRYVIATLVDLRSPADRARFDATAAALGTRIEVVSLAAGTIDLPADLASRSSRVLAEVDAAPAPAGRPGALSALSDFEWPASVPTGGRHGFSPADRPEFTAAIAGLSKAVGTQVVPGDRVLVLGFEELMYLPLRLALALSEDRSDVTVRSSATTRSPVMAVADDGYPIRHALSFPAHDGPDDVWRYVYNVRPPGSEPWDLIVQVVDTLGDTPQLRGGLLEALRPHTRRLLTVTVPA